MVRLISLCFHPVAECCYNFSVLRPFVPTLSSQPSSPLVAHTVQNTHRNGTCPSSLLTLNMGWDKHFFHWCRRQWWRKHIHQIVAMWQFLWQYVIPQTSPTCLKHIWLLSNKVWLTQWHYPASDVTDVVLGRYNRGDISNYEPANNF